MRRKVPLDEAILGNTTDPFPDPHAYWSGATQKSSLIRWRRRLFFKRIIWRLTFGSAEVLKRTLDIVISFLAMILSIPIIAITAIFIKLEDRGPIFYPHPRMGQKGKIFIMWKFRSMVINAEKKKKDLLKHNQHNKGVTFKMKKDPRVTREGRFIRKFSIDEVPQFFNVFKGDMSLVGPRPPVVSEVQGYKASELRRLMVKPGITCSWQVEGRSYIDFHGQVRLDLQYIASQSL